MNLEKPQVTNRNGLDSWTVCCAWCGVPFRRLRQGGREKRFCADRCRAAFHTAARRWVLKAIDAGVITLAEVRALNVPHSTCTLARTADPAAPLPG